MIHHVPDGDDYSKDDAKAGSHYRAMFNVQKHSSGLPVKTLVAVRQRGPTTAKQIATRFGRQMFNTARYHGIILGVRDVADRQLVGQLRTWQLTCNIMTLRASLE